LYEGEDKMSITTLLSNLGAILLLVGTLALLKYTGGLDLLLHAFGWVRDMFSWLMQNKLFSAATFVLLIGIANFIVGFVLSLNYACDSDNHLRSQRLGVIGGVAMVISGIGNELNETDPSYDDFIDDWTIVSPTYSATSERSLVAVGCQAYDPTITVFGVDFLNFRYWMLIMVIVVLAKLYAWKKG
jgi:hypothetical protein